MCSAMLSKGKIAKNMINFLLNSSTSNLTKGTKIMVILQEKIFKCLYIEHTSNNGNKIVSTGRLL